jgi:hypothetical protein
MIEVLLVCLLACLYVFEFPLPLLQFVLSYLLSHLSALAHGLHAIGYCRINKLEVAIGQLSFG